MGVSAFRRYARADQAGPGRRASLPKAGDFPSTSKVVYLASHCMDGTRRSSKLVWCSGSYVADGHGAQVLRMRTSLGRFLLAARQPANGRSEASRLLFRRTPPMPLPSHFRNIPCIMPASDRAAQGAWCPLWPSSTPINGLRDVAAMKPPRMWPVCHAATTSEGIIPLPSLKPACRCIVSCDGRRAS